MLPNLDFDVPFDSQLAFSVCVGDLYETVIKAVRQAVVLRGRGSQVELRQKHDHLSSPTERTGLIGPRPRRVLFCALKMRLHLFICIFELLFHGWIGVELKLAGGSL